MHETYFQHIRTDMISFSRLFRAQNSICMCQFPSVFIIVLQKMNCYFSFALSNWGGVTRLPLGVGLFHSPRTSQETHTLPPHTHHAPRHSLSVVLSRVYFPFVCLVLFLACFCPLSVSCLCRESLMEVRCDADEHTVRCLVLFVSFLCLSVSVPVSVSVCTSVCDCVCLCVL